MEDKKQEVLICKACGGIEKQGSPERMDPHAVETIRMSKDQFTTTDGLCTNCVK